MVFPFCWFPHDLAVIRMLADRTIVMLDGKIIESKNQYLEDLSMLIHSSWFTHCCKEVTNIVIAIRSAKYAGRFILEGKVLLSKETAFWLF